MTKMSNFVQFNNKKHLLQCKVKYNDKTIKIRIASILNCHAFFYNSGNSRKQKQKPLDVEILNFRVLMDCSNQENLKKLKEAI